MNTLESISLNENYYFLNIKCKVYVDIGTKGVPTYVLKFISQLKRQENFLNSPFNKEDDSIIKNKGFIDNLIPLTIFWVLWKERNVKVLESKKVRLYKLKNRWINYFETSLLGHDIIRNENFGNIIDTLTIL